MSWADEDFEGPPVPISFLLDDDVLTRIIDNGLPEDRQGELIRKMLQGTDLGSVIPRHRIDTPWSTMASDIKHLKSRCYWFKNGYLL